jgi:hypothetical protein
MVLRMGGADLEAKEPSVATILTSFENSFDMYGALSTPLYQTATFKQVILNLGLHGHIGELKSPVFCQIQFGYLSVVHCLFCPLLTSFCSIFLWR